MKYGKCFFFLILLCFKPLYSQSEFTVYEGKDTSICGKIVIFDGIWISEGKRYADISVLESENSKPITGGYKLYDEIMIGNCPYYVKEIYKNGVKPVGSIILSKYKPPVIKKEMFVKVELTNNDKLYDDDTLSKIKIYKESNGKAAILTGYKENGIEQKIVLKKGSVIWYEGFPFGLTKISLKRKTAEFLMMKAYSYAK